jgi:hypothetical protein
VTGADTASQASVDWHAWHAGYEDPGSELGRRLAAVQRQLGGALDQMPAGPIRAISVCAGQGHDLIGVLAEHPRRADVSARLVELDPKNVALARSAAHAIGLERVEAVAADASLTDAYMGAVPADVVIVCGVFGNIAAADVANTIEQLGQLCAPQATVIWTRHRRAPDLVPQIRDSFERAGFAEIAFEDAPPFGIGSNRLQRAPEPLCGTAQPSGQPSARCSAQTAHSSSWWKRCVRFHTVCRASRRWKGCCWRRAARARPSICSSPRC